MQLPAGTILKALHGGVYKDFLTPEMSQFLNQPLFSKEQEKES